LRRLVKVIGQDAINRFKEETLVDGELPALNQIFAWLEESGICQYCNNVNEMINFPYKLVHSHSYRFIEI